MRVVNKLQNYLAGFPAKAFKKFSLEKYVPKQFLPLQEQLVEECKTTLRVLKGIRARSNSEEIVYQGMKAYATNYFRGDGIQTVCLSEEQIKFLNYPNFLAAFAVPSASQQTN